MSKSLLVMSLKVAGWGLFLCVMCTFLLSQVNSLRCVHHNIICLSSSSIDDCSKSSKEMTCPDVADSCANISTEVKTASGLLKSYYYGCATNKMCNDAKEQLKVCQNITRDGHQVKCEVKCCKGDFCIPREVTSSHAAMVIPLFSHLLVLSCAILTLSWKL